MGHRRSWVGGHRLPWMVVGRRCGTPSVPHQRFGGDAVWLFFVAVVVVVVIVFVVVIVSIGVDLGCFVVVVVVVERLVTAL